MQARTRRQPKAAQPKFITLPGGQKVYPGSAKYRKAVKETASGTMYRRRRAA